MNLNCLNCHSLQRVNSGEELVEMEKQAPLPRPRGESSMAKRRRSVVDRSWSGNLAPPPPRPRGEPSSMGVEGKKNGHHQRVHSAGLDENGPRLVRSSGMRRDWSFENLRQRRDEMMKELQGH